MKTENKVNMGENEVNLFEGANGMHMLCVIFATY